MLLTHKHAVAAIILLSSFAAPAAAGPYEDADAANPILYKLVEKAATKGNATAQFSLGAMNYPFLVLQSTTENGIFPRL